MNNASVEVFRSTDHPGGLPWGLLIAREGLRPLSVAMLPLMVVTLVSALTTGELLQLVLWGYPTITVLAMAWTAFNVDRRVTEIWFFDSTIVVRSMADRSRGRGGRHLRLFDIRDYGSWMAIAAGDVDITIDRSRWPDYERIRGAARRSISEGSAAA
jgi:hypothetical protein